MENYRGLLSGYLAIQELHQLVQERETKKKKKEEDPESSQFLCKKLGAMHCARNTPSFVQRHMSLLFPLLNPLKRVPLHFTSSRLLEVLICHFL